MKQENFMHMTHWVTQTFAVHSFSVKGPNLWNILPENIRMIDNYDQFKSKLKTFFLPIRIFIK